MTGSSGGVSNPCENHTASNENTMMTKKSKDKGMRAKTTYLELVTGKDIKITDIPDYLNYALVGIFYCKIIGNSSLSAWME